MANITGATKFFPQAKEGFVTTVGTTFVGGAAVVVFTNLVGYNDGDLVVLTINPSSVTNKDVVVGTKSGNSLTGCIWTSGPAAGHNSGETVVDYVTSTHWDLVMKGITTQHNQDGTHAAITATSVSATSITEAGVPLATTKSDIIGNYVVSGGIIAQTSLLTASFSDIVYYYNGVRLTKTGVANYTFTASKDTYVDISNNGTLTYIPVTNNAASPALTANSIRLAIVVTNGSTITSVVQFGSDGVGNILRNTGSTSSVQISNPYKFSVYRSAANVSFASYTPIPFDTKLFDTGTNVDIVTNKGRFTAPVSGFYWFSACCGNSAATSTAMGTALFKNGTLAKNGTQGDPTAVAGGGNLFTVSGMLQLVAGNYVEAAFVGGGGSTIVVGQTACYFEGFLISAT